MNQELHVIQASLIVVSELAARHAKSISILFMCTKSILNNVFVYCLTHAKSIKLYSLDEQCEPAINKARRIAVLCKLSLFGVVNVRNVFQLSVYAYICIKQALNLSMKWVALR